MISEHPTEVHFLPKTRIPAHDPMPTEMPLTRHEIFWLSTRYGSRCHHSLLHLRAGTPRGQLAGRTAHTVSGKSAQQQFFCPSGLNDAI